MTNNKILCVDDDEKILAGIQRQQGDEFDITTAIGPEQALEKIDQEGPFAVVLSDMRMPEMNGVELLSRIREKHPDSVRMILTGYAELTSTIEAVNEGHIFRFLSKPCDEEGLAAAFRAGLRQFALIEAEKELVEGTLQGSVKVLSEVLSLVNPLAFGQTSRIRATVEGILKRVEVENSWQLRIATMLSSIGCITLPSEILEKKFAGVALNAEENTLFLGHSVVGGELLRSIPRLDHVADIIACQNAPTSAEQYQGIRIPRESQIVRLATEFDFMELTAKTSLHALNELKKESDFDDELLDALTDFVNNERNFQFATLMVHEIRQGMVLAQDIRNAGGTLLMSKGQKITKSANRLLENFAETKAIEQPIKVVIAEKVAAVSSGVDA